MAVVLSTIDHVELKKLIQLVRLREPRDDLIECLIQELEALVPLKAEQTAIIEAFDGLIYICSENYVIEFMNRRFIERTGHYPLGEKCYSALHDLDSICPWCVNEKVQRGEKVEWEVLSPKDNRYYAIVNTPIHRPDGSISKMAMIRDITDWVRAEKALKSRTEELERSNKDLEQFAYIAAHDLREPLLAVAAYLKVLDRRYRGRLDLEADKLIAGALNATFRMDSLIQSLLAYSRIGNEDPGFQKSNSQEILGTAIANLQSMIDETGSQITHDPLPWVTVNPSQLLQLFQNLLSNAIKFAGEKPPRIHVGVTRSKDGWQYTVSDNGIGIEPPHFDRIFLLFQRIRNRPDYPGTGIGLANCRRIVEHHGGKIWVESTPGTGSTFHFTIPDRQDSC
jgi:signal transduction histidine kinase